MSNILNAARSKILATRFEQDDKVRQERLERERAFKNALLDALGLLGVENPRINYSSRLIRVDPEKPMFRVIYDGLIITNSDSSYANLVDIADAEHPERLAQFNTLDTAPNWMKRIAVELVLPYMDQEGA